jgi:hypothetical protein
MMERYGLAELVEPALDQQGQARAGAGRPRKPKRRLITVAVVVAVVWAGLALAFPSYTHRYRLTLEVEADGRVRTGSGVIEVAWYSRPTFSGIFIPWEAEIRGQAVPVDVGPHGVLLAALAGVGPEETLGIAARYIALRAFAGTVPELPPLDAARPRGGRDYPLESSTPAVLRRLSGHRATLGPGTMPPLVWLRDPADPTSARPVRPDHLPADTASELRLRGAWIEITRDPITKSLGAHLPWLAAFVAAQRPKVIGAPPGVFRLYWNALSQGVEP